MYGLFDEENYQPEPRTPLIIWAIAGILAGLAFLAGVLGC